MATYKVKKLLDEGLDIDKLDKDQKESIEVIGTLSDDYTTDDDTAHELDDATEAAIRATKPEAIGAKKAEPPAKPPAKKKPKAKRKPPAKPPRKPPKKAKPARKPPEKEPKTLDECKRLLEKFRKQKQKGEATARKISKSVKAAQRKQPLVTAREESIDELEKIPGKKFKGEPDKQKKADKIIKKYVVKIKSLYEQLSKELEKI